MERWIKKPDVAYVRSEALARHGFLLDVGMNIPIVRSTCVVLAGGTRSGPPEYLQLTVLRVAVAVHDQSVLGIPVKQRNYSSQGTPR